MVNFDAAFEGQFIIWSFYLTSIVLVAGDMIGKWRRRNHLSLIHIYHLYPSVWSDKLNGIALRIVESGEHAPQQGFGVFAGVFQQAVFNGLGLGFLLHLD